MKKLFFFILLIIILVSLSWFKPIWAQDLNSLSLKEKAELLKKYKGKLPTPPSKNYYQSADFFKTSDSPQLKNDSTGKFSGKEILGIKHTSQSQTIGSLKKLPDFQDLLPFGMELFQGGNQNDIPTDIPSASDYILGPGDNVIIYLWGRAEKEYNLTLDREGKIFIPQVGEIVCWGLNLDQLTKRAKEQFSKVFSEFDLTVSLGKIRSIRIYIAGEVKKPGAYTVSSLTSLFNALYLAGGPNERGSMRTIKLMRQGKPKAIVDLYNLLLKGDNTSDVRLQTGDVIFVPVAGPQVAIRGKVKRSAIYELKGGETTLDILKLAGNATPEAYLERVMMERISKDNEWKVIDLNLDQQSDKVDNIKLVDGDRLTVYSIFDAKKNIVAVFGHVKHPGYYERNDSTYVSDLIKLAQLRPYDVYFGRADLFRRYPDRRIEDIPIDLKSIVAGDKKADVLLSDKDSLYIYSINEVEWKKYVYVEGEVKKPGRYPLYKDMTVQDLIFLAGSFTQGAYRHQGEIARLDSAANVSLIYLSLDDSHDKKRLLQEDDHLYIRQIPEWQLNRSVSLEGEIRYPGKYTLSSRNETLYHLLQRAGGFTEIAFPKGIVLERQSIDDNLNRMKVAETIKRSNPVREDSLGNIIKNDLVEYNPRSINRIVIDMNKILSTKGKEGDIVLKPNDKIFVPSIPSGISVIGAVGVNGTIKYTNNENVKYYIKRAGNFVRQSDKKETRLIRATGEVLSGHGVLGKKVELGDVIIVPAKIEKQRNLLKNFTTALGAATSVLTSVYIVSKL